MIQNIFGIKIRPISTGITSDDLFRVSLNDVSTFEPMSYVDYYWNSITYYAKHFEPQSIFSDEFGTTDANLIYDRYLNGRFHIPIKDLKYYVNISDFWYMCAAYCGTQPGATVFDQIKMRFVSLQSFGNINLGVDSILIGLQEILPVGKDLNYGFILFSEPGIRLVLFIDKIELVDRNVAGKKITNLQFHFSIKAYLIDPSLGGQYKDFTAESLLSTKTFYFEQTIPTFAKDNFKDPNSLKTGWGHFIYPAAPVASNDYANIKYVQLGDVLKIIYNSIFFCQNTNNPSLQVNSLNLRDWLDVDITLRNAVDDYEPDCITQTQANPPAFPFTDVNVLEDWLAYVLNQAVEIYGGADPGLNFIMSYDNIYWEPMNDNTGSDIYSNSPSTFMTRLTSYYEGLGETPIDEPGNFSAKGGFVKARRKSFLANLFYQFTFGIREGSALYISTNGKAFADNMNNEYPERFMGSKFFPFYKFKQWKNQETQKELLDVLTIPFTGAITATNIVDCETSQDLKRVVSPYETFTPYRKKIITKPDLIPNESAATALNPIPSTTQKINAIGYVDYHKDDNTIVTIPLNANLASENRIFSFLSWPFIGINYTLGISQWTSKGRYRLIATNIEINVPNNVNPFFFNTFTSKANPISLCTTLTCGMYETTEDAYKKWKSIIADPKVYITSDPSPTDPDWEDYYDCLDTAEITEEIVEYCDPLPSGEELIRRKGTQKYTVSSSGVKTPVGDPVWSEPPTTTFVDNNATQVYPNGKVVTGKRITIYKNCNVVESIFQPDVIPTGPTGPTTPVVTGPVFTGPTGPVVTGPVVTGPVVTGPTGPVGPTNSTSFNVSFEEFINPAIFKRNVLTLSPSDDYIPLLVENSFYTFKFKYQDMDEPSSRYKIRLSPGVKGQVVIFEIDTLNPRCAGVLLQNGDMLTNKRPSERVYISTPTWGDGGGQPFRSYLFLISDGKNWIEFLRRDIY